MPGKESPPQVQDVMPRYLFLMGEASRDGVRQRGEVRFDQVTGHFTFGSEYGRYRMFDIRPDPTSKL